MTVLKRWGGPITLILACVLVPMGIWGPGLWDPWEMNAAQVARRMAEAPRVLVAEGRDGRLAQRLEADLADGATVLTGTPRMRERPVADLLDGLRQLKIDAVSLSENGCPPIRVIGGAVTGGRVSLRCGVSSQYLSGILLMAPLTRNGVEIAIVEGPVSKPYIDMTVDIMEKMGIQVSRDGYERFLVPGKQPYRHGCYIVDIDENRAVARPLRIDLHELRPDAVRSQ